MSLTEASLEKKLQAATNSQDSIQTLSLWLLHHKAHHQKIVAAWLKVLRKAKINHRLTLFYLANDVIQNSKRKGISHFKDSFSEILKEATLLVREEQIRNSVSRVFRIWGERNVYDNAFIEDLQSILANSKVPATAPSKLLAEFKCENVIEKLRSVSKLEMETTSKMATLNISKLNATDAEIVQKLKDRKHGQQFSAEFDESARCLEEVVKSFSKEVQERNDLILLLEQSKIYYDTQRGEAKIVANAYKNFGSRVKSLQKKLEELMETFPAPSPIPSPCPDAPSPTTSEAELELPSEDVQSDISKCDDMEEENEMAHSENDPSDSFITSLTTSSGTSIPILSTFLNQGAGKMTSWLDAFPKKDPVISETSTSKSGSLDSRLSSLLQKIPNLPDTLQGTLLSATGMSENERKSPLQTGTKMVSSFPASNSTTPVKDECSGQNTPLQDEDISVPSSASSFFSRLASAPKSSQSPKDILKGLTNLIQTAASKEKSLKSDTWQPENESNINQVGSFLNKIVPNQSSHILSPPPFFSSPGLSSDTRKNDSSDNSTSTSHTSGSTLHSQSFTSQSTTTKSLRENLSFIPTLVPSTPTGSHFSFQGENDLDEYDPTAQNFDMEIETESGGEEESVHSPCSCVHSDSTPEKEAQEELMESLSTSRQSTLITLVTDSPGLDGENPKLPIVSKDNLLPTMESYSAVPSLNQAENWPSVSVAITVQPDEAKDVTSSSGSVLPVDPFFTPTVSPVLTDKMTYPNGKEQAFTKHPHSRIETVQSFRTPNESKWPENDWVAFDKDYRQEFDGPGRQGQRPQGYPVYQQKSYPNFEGRRYGWNQQQDWHYSDYNKGPPHKRFPPPFARGRGWRRHPHPY